MELTTTDPTTLPWTCPTVEITAANGIPFRLRLIGRGDRYGQQHCLIHDSRMSVVEFYDARHDFDYDFTGTREEAQAARARCLGQYVARHHLSTLLEGRSDSGPGIDLHGGVPAWTIDGPSLWQGLQDLDSMAMHMEARHRRVADEPALLDFNRPELDTIRMALEVVKAQIEGEDEITIHDAEAAAPDDAVLLDALAIAALLTRLP